MKNIVRMNALFISYCLVFTSFLYANEERNTGELSISAISDYTINSHVDLISIPIQFSVTALPYQKGKEELRLNIMNYDKEVTSKESILSIRTTDPTFNNLPKIISLDNSVSEPVSFSVTNTKGFLLVSANSDYAVSFTGGGVSLIDMIQVLKILTSCGTDSILFDINNDGRLGFEELGTLLQQIQEKKSKKNSYIIKANTDAFFSINLLPGQFEDVEIDIAVTDFLGYKDIKSITVTRSYNNAPFIECNQIFSTNDHANLKTVLGIVMANDIDGDPLSYTITQILPDTSQANTFIIDTAAGQIKLNTDLNAKEVSLYTLTVSISDGISRTSANVIVQVTDDNHPPVIYIGDHEKINTIIGQPLTVTDDDPNDPISFSITQIMPPTFLKPFRIDPDTGVIILNVPLNAKEVQLYTLTVSVFDGISKAHADVIVQVVDDNYTPVITVEPVEISDHATINTILGRPLRVTDIDPNDPISFSITQIMPPTFLKPFRIDPDTGVIILNAPLNAKEVQLYTLTVSVFDGISKAHADVIVQVVDDNYTPVITVEPVEIGDHATINTSLGRPLTVTDIDPNDPISYNITRIMPHPLTRTFLIDSQTGEIILNVPLNAKEVQLYTLTVSVFDGISTTSVCLFVHVIDDNYGPEIAVEPLEIGDHAKINTMIGQPLTVIDNDPNDPISYTITQILPNPLTKTFRIDPQKGEIILNVPLNAKEVQLYTLTVSVCDGISKAHAGVIVKVIDDNHPPLITVEPLEIGDHAAINTSLGRPLTVTDYDPNDPIVYTISQIMPISLTKAFLIDPEIGEITLNAPLNAKEVSFYTLTISVYDGVSRTHVNLIIHVIDDNYWPEIAVETLEIGDHAKINTIIGQPLTVTDYDPNDPISYAITQIMPSSITQTFLIDPETGVLTLNAPLNAKEVQLYTLTVSVCDGISCTFADLIVRIIDDNYPPVITVEPQLESVIIPLTDEYLYNKSFY